MANQNKFKQNISGINRPNYKLAITKKDLKPTWVQKKPVIKHNSLPVDFENSHSSLNFRLIDNIPQTLRPKNLMQI